MGAQRILAVVEYDGAQFKGFQIQKNGRSVQEVLEKALAKVLQEKVRIYPSGRTDSGVHAVAHPFHFDTQTCLTPPQVLRAVNSVLPQDVVVKKTQKVSSKFHARFSAKSKIYRYHIWNSRIRSPLKRHDYAIIYEPLDVKAMREALKQLVGKHDFKAFCASGSKVDSTVRTIKKAILKTKGSEIIVEFEADGFLYNQVRNMIGTLLWVGHGKLKPNDIPRIFKTKDRKNAGPTAPAQGLTLLKVKY